MTTAVLFPDVEARIIAALPGLLATRGYPSIVVATRVPNPRPARFVRALVTGGDRRNLVQDAATVTLEGWAESETAANTLTRVARACLDLMGGAHDFGPPVNLPDPDSAQCRYTTTGALHVRGAAFA
jgi:metal-dependent amidase/aminoacylase/carboxypeptidase family protein